MDQLPAAVLHSVLAKTNAVDCARAGCVDRRWNQNSMDEALWQSYCLRDFQVSSPMDPRNDPCDSFKAAYKSWRTAFAEYPMPLVARAKLCIDQIKGWLSGHFPEVLESLLPGRSFEDIRDAEAELGFELPAPVRLLYYLCDGQRIPDGGPQDYEDDDSETTNLVGVLGGYYFYQHFVNVHLLPLRQMVKLTLGLVPKLELPPGSKRVVIAASCNLMKIFFLDCEDGQVYVGTENLQVDGEMMPCTPKPEGGVDLKDGMLRWLEWYAHCLQTGVYDVRVESGIRSISLFPLREPTCTNTTTRGVQIRISAVFVPERSSLDDSSVEESFMFAYSVGMRLLPPTREHGNSSLKSAQLLARHWIIRPDGFPKNEVRGEAVIGLYPILKAGESEFVYQSCSSLKGRKGSIEGDFTFVPGRIEKPEGAEFAAYVSQVPMEVPQYIL